jgi:hypothetical protein
MCDRLFGVGTNKEYYRRFPGWVSNSAQTKAWRMSARDASARVQWLSVARGLAGWPPEPGRWKILCQFDSLLPHGMSALGH